MGDANMLGVNPVHVEVTLLCLHLVLQAFHFPRCFQKRDARISIQYLTLHTVRLGVLIFILIFV